MTHHAAGVGTCSQSGLINPSHPSSQMHLGKFPDRTEFQSWIVKARAGICAKACARIAVDQENQSRQLAEGPHQSGINKG